MYVKGEHLFDDDVSTKSHIINMSVDPLSAL